MCAISPRCVGCWELEFERETVNTLVSVPFDGVEEAVRKLHF